MLLVTTAGCSSGPGLLRREAVVEVLASLVRDHQNAVFGRPVLVRSLPLATCGRHPEPQRAVETSLGDLGYALDAQGGYPQWRHRGGIACARFAARARPGTDARISLDVCFTHVRGPTECSVVAAAIPALVDRTSEEIQRVLGLSDALQGALLRAVGSGYAE